MKQRGTAWIDGVVETLYESFKAGKGVTFPGFGGFYVRPEPESWVFKFNPGQRCIRFWLVIDLLRNTLDESYLIR
jgi:hypothetical protein